MMNLIEIELVLPEGRLLNQSIGSVLQGAIMEKIPSAWAEKLHEQQVHPYSQYVTVQNKKPLWRIATLTDEAFENISEPLMKCEQISLRKSGYDVGLKNAHIVRQETYESLAGIYWGQMKKIHHADIHFVTSTSFKTQGGYAVYPMPHLIFKGLIKKWNKFSTVSELKEENMADQLATQTEIIYYKLHMHPYSLEGRRIKAFRGEWRLGYFRNDIAERMISMLLDFANFAGSGIKTGMGMGGTETMISFWKEEGYSC